MADAFLRATWSPEQRPWGERALGPPHPGDLETESLRILPVPSPPRGLSPLKNEAKCGAQTFLGPGVREGPRGLHPGSCRVIRNCHTWGQPGGAAVKCTHSASAAQCSLVRITMLW